MTRKCKITIAAIVIVAVLAFNMALCLISVIKIENNGAGCTICTPGSWFLIEKR